jgi:hypothetical protein
VKTAWNVRMIALFIGKDKLDKNTLGYHLVESIQSFTQQRREINGRVLERGVAQASARDLTPTCPPRPYHNLTGTAFLRAPFTRCKVRRP